MRLTESFFFKSGRIVATGYLGGRWPSDCAQRATCRR